MKTTDEAQKLQRQLKTLQAKLDALQEDAPAKHRTADERGRDKREGVTLFTKIRKHYVDAGLLKEQALSKIAADTGLSSKTLRAIGRPEGSTPHPKNLDLLRDYAKSLGLKV